MKCLSIKQPWASLIAAGIKEVENRPWETRVRGEFFVHAAKAYDKTADPCSMCRAEWCYGCPLDPAEDDPPEKRLPRGAIIGRAWITGCVVGDQSPWAQAGQIHFRLEGGETFSKPVPFPGRLGFFHVPDFDKLYAPHDGTTKRVCVTEEVPDIMITRPGKWGNPFIVKQWMGASWFVVLNKKKPYTVIADHHLSGIDAVDRMLELYEQHVRKSPALMAALPELKGKRLGCFCEPDQRCHGDVLVKLVQGLRAG